MSNAADYVVRTMTRAEVDLAVEWAAREGWNPGLSDAACYYAADPNGFLIGLLDGEPIACISAVKYSRDFGFLGFYIVKPEYRGCGYGIRIWNAALHYLEGCNIGLDGVVAQQDNYRKSGFKLAYQNVRYEGRGGGDAPLIPGLVDLAELPFETVAAYGRAFFPANRDPFTKAWLTQPDARALGIQQADQLVACGVIRPCRTGYKIGPMFADSPELAESLFQALTATVSTADPIYLDVPQVNAEAVQLAERHEMMMVFETARMYTGDAPVLPIDRVFGVMSFEVG
ncbi:MAG: GNAT family N-acetyltransferase [Chromatiales bacterium]|nr:GNAT family N-acetyltransferase [Chromatiales bacterium]